MSSSLSKTETTKVAAQRLCAALIDMDGTLYDSMGNHSKAWARLMTDCGIPFDKDEFYLYEGMTGRATINLLFEREFGHGVTPEEAAELYHRKTLYFQELGPVKPMEGANRMLQHLKNAGVQCILVTGSGQHSLIDRLNHDFPGIFDPDKLVTSYSVTHGKPHPEPYLKALEVAGVRPDQAIAIENAPLGVESAVKAGVYTIGLNTGPLGTNVLLDAGADVLFPSMAKFADLVELFIK